MTGTTGPRTERRAASLGGVVGAAVALAATELAAGILPGAQSPLSAVADRIIELAPAFLVTAAIALLGAAIRSVLLVAMLAVAAGAGALIGRWTRRWRWAAPTGFAPFALIGATAGIADPLLPPVTAVGAPLVGAAAGVLLLWRFPGVRGAGGSAAAAAQGTHTTPAGTELSDPASPAIPSRRDVLVWGASALGAAVAVAAAGRLLQARAVPTPPPGAATLPTARDPLPTPPPAASLDVDGITPLITPNDDFFRIDTAFRVPRVDAAGHVVRVTGMVDRPFEVGYDELLRTADTEADVTLVCVSNEVGGDLAGNARWLGVPLERLLDRAGVHPEATQVVGRAVDGWTAGFPLEVLDGRPALVAVGMNGEPLPVDHGFPVRLVIAGLYGYVSDTKWLSEIELTTFDAYDAYWAQRGWAREGPIKTQSRIDVPRDRGSVPPGPMAVAGVAWADERGVSRVEVSIDDGPWQEAELAEELATTTWRQWRLRWDAEPGEHVIRVRATDGAGQTQTDERSRPFPDGATGHHTIRVTVQ